MIGRSVVLTDCCVSICRADPEGSPVPTNLRAMVYNAAIRSGGQAEWEFLYDRYLQRYVLLLTTLALSRPSALTRSDRTSAAEASRCLNALSATRVPWLLQRLLEYALDPNKIRSQVFRY